LASAGNTRDLENQNEARMLIDSWLQQGGKGLAISRLRFLGQELYAAQLLQNYALDARAEVREGVAEALADLCVGQSERALLALVQDEEPPVRMSAARGLGCIHSVAAAKPLRKLLNDPASGVRSAAGRALGALHDPHDGPALMRVAQMEGDLEVRSVLVEALGETHDRRQLPFLKTLLKSSSDLTRQAAARALCRMGDPAGFQFVRPQLNAAEQTDRLQAIELLERTELRRARPLLEPLLEDSDRKVSAKAALALYRCGDTPMLAWLVKAAHTARLEDKRAYEDALEALDVTDEQRAAILQSAGLK
jgi:HEAT repeat protein